MERTNTLLIIGAHPDDCEFGAGGTSFEWSGEGTEVHFAIVTDGSKGSADGTLSGEKLVRQRQREQRFAASLLGVRQCHFLGFTDGEVAPGPELHRALVKLIRELKPETVLTHTPEHLNHRPFQSGSNPSINHRDHRAVGQCVLDAIYPSAQNPHEFKELGLEPHRVSQVGLWGGRFADTHVTSLEGMQKKAEALALHKSQFPDQDKLFEIALSWDDFETFELVRP